MKRRFSHKYRLTVLTPTSMDNYYFWTLQGMKKRSNQILRDNLFQRKLRDATGLGNTIFLSYSDRL